MLLTAKNYLRFIGILLLVFATSAHSKNQQDTLESVRFYREFVRLENYDDATTFYRHAKTYLHFLEEKGFYEEYFKIKTHVGIYATTHKEVFQASQIAEELEEKIEQYQYYDFRYLVTGLKGDIHKAMRSQQADSLYRQAIKEAGEGDPKFTMLTSLSLAEAIAITQPDKALEWANRSLAKADSLENVEYRSLSLGIKGYVHFMRGDRESFEETAQQYRETKERYDSLNALGQMRRQQFNNRYEGVMDVAQLAFSGHFDKAKKMAQERELNMDRQMVLYIIYGLEGLHEKEQAARTLLYWFIAITVIYFIIYITGRQRLLKKIWKRNKELRVALEQADAANRMKASFIRSMSHEIRTPLNAISGFTQILCSKEYDLNDKEKSHLKKTIEANSQAISRIINEMLEMAADDGVRLDLRNLLPVDISETCRKIVREANRQNDKHLYISFQSNLPDRFKLNSNEETITKILQNLLNNAMKFTDEGRITIEASLQKDAVLISVTDTGIGVPEEQQEAIFDCFVKLDDFKAGIGLGLPISLRLANSLGGNLTLDKTYKKGSRFILQLPVIS